ncbi:hypothetical protein AVEN_256645-1 [Araneus ventricosus]|uniref:Uncharacterized protein n=1 Tax=Araneus ventricosus TaxID=182803 RepID=A0A4Y2NEF5_ARAVE|nr:hypothetical protein AVEN_256645-1 [Araneus ventricosus]
MQSGGACPPTRRRRERCRPNNVNVGGRCLAVAWPMMFCCLGHDHKLGMLNPIVIEQYAAILEGLNKEEPPEDESNASDHDEAEVSEYSEHDTDSEIDVEDNPDHEVGSDSNLDANGVPGEEEFF